MLKVFWVAVVLLLTYGASLLLERLFDRSRKEVWKPGYFIVLFVLFAPAAYFVSAFVSLESPWIYAAYGAAAGLASLIAQAAFGARTRNPDSLRDGNDA